MADEPDDKQDPTENASANMVLRTLYLPRELDEELKSAAVRGARSKGDVIRELILAGLQARRRDTGSYIAEPSGATRKAFKPAMVKPSLVTRKAAAAKPAAGPGAKTRARTVRETG